MPVIPALIIQNDPAAAIASTGYGCPGCAHPCAGTTGDTKAGPLGLHAISPANLTRLLFHTLLLPLMLLTGSVVAADTAGLPEPFQIALAVLALGLGIMFCRTLPANTIELIEDPS